MKTIKSILTTFILAASAVAFGQASQVTFASADDIWKTVNDTHTSKFSVTGDQAMIVQISDLYEGLGDDVTYSITTEGDVSTVVMTFSSAVAKPYVYKMLLYIGCEQVVVAGQSMSLDSFNAMLNE